MTALTSASQNSTTSRRRSVHQRSLPSWLPHAWVRSTGQRRWPGPVRAARGEQSHGHAARGQHLPAGLVVVAGAQVHHGSAGSLPIAVLAPARVSRVAPSSPSSRRLAAAGTAPSGMPPAAVTVERLRPYLRRSTGPAPATCPPQVPW